MIAIGPATAAERAAVGSLLEAAGLPTAGLDRTWLLVARDEPTSVAAGKPTGEGPVVGAVGLEAYPPAGIVRSLVVSGEWRDRGVGTALVARLLEAADARGVTDLWLLTTTAAPFFGRLGFKPARRDSAPAAVAGSVEFREACPASAVCLRRGPGG
jgi:amino-acid N-acetyltransferase